MRAMPHVWALEKEESAKALELLEKALAIDSEYPLALSLAGWCHAQRSVYNWADDIADSPGQGEIARGAGGGAQRRRSACSRHPPVPCTRLCAILA